MKPLVLACVLLLARTPGVLAQNGNVPPTQTELIQSLMTRIEQLERRIAELEASKAQAAPVQPPTAMDMPIGVQAEQVEIHPTLHIAGFGDVNFSATNQPGTNSGFTLGQFILHMNSNLSPKVSFMGELSFSARTDAGIGTPPATGFNAEVERSIIRFEHNDYLKLSFGRYHTPINYWNTAFHHGQWLQTTANRPEMVQFGGKFIPVHFVGGLVEGAVGAGGLNLNYNLGIGNGRGAVISRGGDPGDANNFRAWLANVFVKPDRLYGLQLGGSVYRDKVTTGGRDYNQWITSAHFIWNRETPEFLAEFANIRNENLTTPTPATNSQAYYIQTGYRLPLAERRLKPYYRFDYIHVPKSDTLLQPISNLAGSSLGMRYDISSFAAMKFEFRNQRRAPGVPRINGAFLQTSFTF